MLAQEPPISKLVIALKKFYSVAFCEAQLVGTAGLEIVCGNTRVSHCVQSLVSIRSRFSAGKLTDDDKEIAHLGAVGIGCSHCRPSRAAGSLRGCVCEEGATLG